MLEKRTNSIWQYARFIAIKVGFSPEHLQQYDIPDSGYRNKSYCIVENGISFKCHDLVQREDQFGRKEYRRISKEGYKHVCSKEGDEDPRTVNWLEAASEEALYLGNGRKDGDDCSFQYTFEHDRWSQSIYSSRDGDLTEWKLIPWTEDNAAFAMMLDQKMVEMSDTLAEWFADAKDSLIPSKNSKFLNPK